MAHPLLDRRDITAARNADQEKPEDHSTRLAAAIALNTELLQKFLLQQRADISSQLCVTDREPMEAIMQNWPVPGARRFVIRRTGEGGTFTVTTTGAQVLDANETRIGGSIVNSGVNPITLTLTANLIGTGGAPLAGSPQIFLAAAGGTWDFRLGNALWCGHVFAQSSGGSSSLVIAEV